MPRRASGERRRPATGRPRSRSPPARRRPSVARPGRGGSARDPGPARPSSQPITRPRRSTGPVGSPPGSRASRQGCPQLRLPLPARSAGARRAPARIVPSGSVGAEGQAAEICKVDLRVRGHPQACAGWGSSGTPWSGKPTAVAAACSTVGVTPRASRPRAAATSASRVRAFCCRRPVCSYGIDTEPHWYKSLSLMGLKYHEGGSDVPGRTPTPSRPTRSCTRCLFENDRVRVLEYRDPAGRQDRAARAPRPGHGDHPTGHVPAAAHDRRSQRRGGEGQT